MRRTLTTCARPSQRRFDASFVFRTMNGGVSAKVLDQGIDYQSGSEHPRSIGCRTPPGCVYFSKTMSRYVSSRLMSLLRGYFLMISDQTEKMEQTETTKAHPSVPSIMSFP